MKKIVFLLMAVASVSGCSHIQQKLEDNRIARYNKAVNPEKHKSFVYREDAFDVFKGLECNKYKDSFIEQAKVQIGENETLDLYSKIIAMEYFDLAMNEYKNEKDYIDGRYFFNKAVSAAKGTYPLPENVRDWRVERRRFEEIKWASEDMMNLIYDEGILKDPINVAKAQVYFDCWIEEQAENATSLEARTCKKNFSDKWSMAFNNIHSYGEGSSLYASEESLDAIVDGFSMDENAKYLDLEEVRDLYYANYLNVEEAQEEMEVIEEEIISLIKEEFPEEADSDIKIEKVSNGEYNLFFALNYTSPKSGDVVKISSIAEAFKAGDYSYIIIKAYTDRSGSDKVNKRISENRGRTIKNMLIKEGIDASKVSFFAFGENATPDQDGVKNSEYRKVVVNFQ
ncbi:MAG: OmpA family protein [Alphaproteobacteria bacterium]|nr:OmpA family protein [Alphaproteobacteria bacterium]